MRYMKKQNLYYALLGGLCLLLLIGMTYAYFVAQGGVTSSSSVRVQTSTTDSLSFSVGSSINLTADQTSFASGKGNITGSTTATALLTANNATNKATSHYFLYLDISKNELTYTTSSKTAELLLTVTDAAGKTVTSLDGLNYVTSGGVSGFDITTTTGIIKLADNYEISASPNKTDTWKVGVTLVNLDSDQTANSGKSVTATLIIQKDIMNTLAEHVMDLYTADGENNLYYHNANLSGGANDNSYRYVGADASVNNYVCFGSNADVCPDDNLYRIIGVFEGKVKLVKYTAATSSLLGTDGDYASESKYYWNYKNDTTLNSGNGSNDWSTSLLNKTNLNKNFLNNIGTDWASKIAYVNWQIGGNANSKLLDVAGKEVYQNEIVNPNKNKLYYAKVGLLYLSDFAYSTASDNWDTVITKYTSTITNNWLMASIDNTLLITPLTSNNYSIIRMQGSFDSGYAGLKYGTATLRYTFYLENNVLYTGGDGSISLPFKIA